MNFSETPEFTRELKRFRKSYRSLDKDVDDFKLVISDTDKLEEIHFFDGPNATRLRIGDGFEVIKARLDCADLGNKQMLRIVYILRGDEVLFVELFSKGEKSREDVALIKREL